MAEEPKSCMAKERVPIPEEVVTSIMYLSNRTCCLCNEPGRPVQIHHIDEDPSNNEVTNLAILCLLCHDETMIKGGFGRKLSAAQVSKYRDEWYSRVQTRRETADKIASHHKTEQPHARAVLPPCRPTLPDPQKLENYIRILPAIRRDIYSRSQPMWNSGNSSEMRRGSYDLIDVLEQMLITLATWYPDRHFGGLEHRDYMNAMTASRFTWHYAHLEPNGIGSGGHDIRIMVGGEVIGDLELMIVDMVRSLFLQLDEEGYLPWKKQWDDAETASSKEA